MSQARTTPGTPGSPHEFEQSPPALPLGTQSSSVFQWPPLSMVNQKPELFRWDTGKAWSARSSELTLAATPVISIGGTTGTGAEVGSGLILVITARSATASVENSDWSISVQVPPRSVDSKIPCP